MVDSGRANEEEEVFAKMQDYEKNHLHYVMSEQIRGKRLDMKKLRGTPLHDMYVSTLSNIQHTLTNIEDFIKAFFSNPVLPVRVSKMKEMVRDTIVLSDTDSTCATYDDFVTWYYGGRTTGGNAVAVTGAVGLFVSETLAHLLRQFVTHMGIEENQKHLLSMKNEYYWSVFMPANVSKHYIALTKIIEGNILNEAEVEKKGANIIASTLSPYYGSILESFIKDLLLEIDSGKTISVMKYINFVSDIEQEIIHKVHTGDSDAFRTDSIKSFESYKSDDVSKTNYYHHELWNSIFGEKYGMAPDPQYMVFKVNITLDNEKKIAEWVEQIEDVDIREKARAFMEKYKKKKLGMLRLPVDRITNAGIPEELKVILDAEEMVSNNITPFFIILELLGVNPKHGVLLKDQYDL
jgi:hypothetical protein